MINEELFVALECAVNDIVELENEKTGNLRVMDKYQLIKSKIDNYIEIAKKKVEKFNMDYIDIEKNILKMKIGDTINFNKYFNISRVLKGYVIFSKINQNSMVFIPE
jgi:hypothetical protein